MKTFKILLLASTALLTANFAPAQTWTQTSAPSTNWQSIASSADGSKLVASGFRVDGPIYTSTNSGATWTLTSAPSQSWNSVASSADGIQLVAVQYVGSIYT